MYFSFELTHANNPTIDNLSNPQQNQQQQQQQQQQQVFHTLVK